MSFCKMLTIETAILPVQVHTCGHGRADKQTNGTLQGHASWQNPQFCELSAIIAKTASKKHLPGQELSANTPKTYGQNQTDTMQHKSCRK